MAQCSLVRLEGSTTRYLQTAWMISLQKRSVPVRRGERPGRCRTGLTRSIAMVPSPSRIPKNIWTHVQQLVTSALVSI